MGMIGNYIAVSGEELSEIQSGKREIYPLLEDGRASCDIDKSWDMLNFTLTGERGDGEAPASYVVPLLSSQGINSDELDFGGNYILAGQVKEVAAYLSELTEEKLRALYDHGELERNEVYALSTAEDDFDYICSYLPVLREFFGKAAENGNAVVFFIS